MLLTDFIADLRINFNKKNLFKFISYILIFFSSIVILVFQLSSQAIQGSLWGPTLSTIFLKTRYEMFKSIGAAANQIIAVMLPLNDFNISGEYDTQDHNAETNDEPANTFAAFNALVTLTHQIVKSCSIEDHFSTCQKNFHISLLYLETHCTSVSIFAGSIILVQNILLSSSIVDFSNLETLLYALSHLKYQKKSKNLDLLN